LWLPGGAPRIAGVDATVTARRVLARAAVLLGGVCALGERLEVTQRQLGDYLTGALPIPDALFLAAIDIVLEELPDPSRPARAAERHLARGSPDS
jgi:hypothetical protein